MADVDPGYEADAQSHRMQLIITPNEHSASPTGLMLPTPSRGVLDNTGSRRWICKGLDQRIFKQTS